jgi:glycosyltransferase involved in cell wall biosynthesis
MATGLPVVVSNLACFRDFVRPGENGLVFDHRASNPAEGLGQALAQLIDDPALAARMGSAGAATATGFGYEQVADAYIADFRDLVGT